MAATHPQIELIPFLRGELNAAERERVQHHLDDCGECRAELDALGATMRLVSARLEELPAPEWSAYRRELRLKLANRAESRSRWWRRPIVLWPSIATAGVATAALILALSMRPGSRNAAPAVDLLAMEQPAEAVDVGLLDNYPVVEKLDLLEDYDVIEHLDQVPAATHQDDTRS
jgi:anti-sigma factor RsiW